MNAARAFPTTTSVDSFAVPVADAIAWSWADLAPTLHDEVSHPSVVVKLVSPSSRMFYWEVHFEDGRRTRVDFLHRIGLGPAVGAAPQTADPIVAALSAWFASGDVARHCHASAWLEVDGPLARGAPLSPQGVSVCLDPDIGSPRTRDPARIVCSTSTVQDIFARLRVACGCAPSEGDTIGRVHRAVTREGGVLRHLSVMRGRSGQPSKIYASLPKGSLVAFLDDVRWPGNAAVALHLADLACVQSKRINLDLEIRDGLTPRIGFELFFDPSPADDPLRTTPLAFARSLQLISPADASALAAWVGAFDVVFGGAAAPIRIQRWLDLKFVLLPDRVELKGYLGFRLCESMV